MSSYTRGRHRLGTPGLRHCRELPAVRARLERHTARHASPRVSMVHRPVTPSMALALLVICVGAIAIAGWIAGDTPAIADIIGR